MTAKGAKLARLDSPCRSGCGSTGALCCRLLSLGWHHALLTFCLSPSALGAQRPIGNAGLGYAVISPSQGTAAGWTGRKAPRLPSPLGPRGRVGRSKMALAGARAGPRRGALGSAGTRHLEEGLADGLEKEQWLVVVARKI